MGKALAFNNKVKVQNQGTPIGSYTTFNFTGTGVTASDAGSGVVNVTINGATNVWFHNGNTVVSEKYIGTNDNFDFPIYTNGTRKVTVLKGSTAKVGIGTATPGTTLDLVSDNTAGDVDVLSLRSTGTGVSPASQTGVMWYSWVNSFQNNPVCRMVATFDTVNVIDNRFTIQTRDAGGSFIDLFNLQNHSMKIIGQYYSLKFTLTDAATIALDWNNSNVQYVELAGNRTFTFANPKDGSRYIIIIKQTGGGNTVTWPATVLWPGGTPPTLTAGAGKVDVITFVYDGTNTKYYGGSNLNY